jgi:hypothetical protein
MTITPFLALHLGGKKDAVLARQRARRVAGLLSFDPHEQACIAAGTFLVACQALMLFGKARLCFQIENHQLHVFAEEASSAPAKPTQPVAQRLAGLFPETEAKTLFRLVKPLPPQQNSTEEMDVGWLVQKMEETASVGIFEEIVKQNQEILALLHELRLFRADPARKEEKSASPHAA